MSTGAIMKIPRTRDALFLFVSRRSYLFSFPLCSAFPSRTISDLAGFMAHFIVRPTFNDPFYEWYVRDSVIQGLRHRDTAVTANRSHPRVPNSKSFNSITRRSEWLLLFFLATISAELPSLIGKFIRYMYQW